MRGLGIEGGEDERDGIEIEWAEEGVEDDEDDGSEDEDVDCGVGDGICDGIGIGNSIQVHQSSSCILLSSIPADINKAFTPRGTKKVTGRIKVERVLSVRRASTWRWS
jgi:hypothetical protein